MRKVNPETYIGMTCTMNCGMKATIIAYRNAKDIDVRFEDNTVRKHTNISSFNTGRISLTPRVKNQAHIGQTKLMRCGLNATIIAYRNAKDIDVRFENGTVRKHMDISRFNKCEISIKSKLKAKNYLGQTRLMKCGMYATVIAYRKYKDIDVQFEDGTMQQHVHLRNFNQGWISHPTNILFNKYEISKIAFAFHNKTYFYVTYTENDSEISDIMCVDDMKQKLPASA